MVKMRTITFFLFLENCIDISEILRIMYHIKHYFQTLIPVFMAAGSIKSNTLLQIHEKSHTFF